MVIIRITKKIITFRRFNRIVLSSSLLIISLNCVFSELVKHRTCGTSKYCKIVNVSITPCAEARTNKPCKVYRGKNFTWSFSFIPQFSGHQGSLFMESYAHMFDNLDVPDPKQDRNPCKYTQCPFTEGAQRTLTYPVYILPTYPQWNIKVKWRLWNDKKQECCFMSDIQIR